MAFSQKSLNIRLVVIFFFINNTSSNCLLNRVCEKLETKTLSLCLLQGCQPALEKYIKDRILWVAVGALVIAFVQVRPAILICLLYAHKNIRANSPSSYNNTFCFVFF